MPFIFVGQLCACFRLYLPVCIVWYVYVYHTIEVTSYFQNMLGTELLPPKTSLNTQDSSPVRFSTHGMMYPERYIRQTIMFQKM
jgi:hypothetical protein